mgnify:CR=1 FL=1
MPDMEEPPAYDRDPEQEWTMEIAAKRVRKYVRDIEGKNELLMGEVEHDWEEIYDAIEDAIMAWNQTRPLTNDQTVEDIDQRAYRLIRMKSAAYLLESAAQNQARNNLNYNDHGFSVSENDKAQVYLSMARQENKKFERNAGELKKALNIESFWGGVSGDIYSKTREVDRGYDRNIE